MITYPPEQAPGEDKITTEMLQYLDQIGIETITKLCNKIQNIEFIPDNMKKSALIVLPKRTKAVICKNFEQSF